jgi:hypothetical protein
MGRAGREEDRPGREIHEITDLNRWRKQWYGGRSPSGGIPPS